MGLLFAFREKRMIKHIVMWRLKDDPGGLSKAAAAEQMKTALEDLADRIPEIREIEVGINIAPNDAAFDVCLYSVFASQADLNAYQQHPDHQAVVDFVRSVVSERVVVDYEA